MNAKAIHFFIIFTFIFIVSADICYANAADVNIVNEILKSFKEESDKWFDVVQDAALALFKWCIYLEIAYIGIRAVISQTDIREIFQNFIMALLAAGFFLAVINNYQEWTSAIIFGLQSLAGKMTTLNFESDNPFKMGIDLITIINNQVANVSWKKFGIIFSAYIAAFIIMICFSLITAKIILIKCEVIIATMAALILVPLGATTFFREYAINTLRYVLSVAFKLFTMQLVIGVGFSFIQKIGMNSEADMDNVAVIIGFAVVLLAISTSLPDTVAGIITSSSGGSGGGLMNSVRSVGSVAGAGAGIVAAGKTMSNARKIAQADGASGFMGVAKGMGKAIMSAKHQAGMRKTSIGGEIRERLTEINEKIR